MWLREDFGPEQVSGWLRRFRMLSISHETIYRYIWTSKRRGGTLHKHLRCARKKRRKRTAATTPEAAWPERGPSVEATNRRAIELIRRTERRVRSVTVDDGTEFHGYKAIEAAPGADFFFATPHHSWERGANEPAECYLSRPAA